MKEKGFSKHVSSKKSLFALKNKGSKKDYQTKKLT